MKPWSCSIIHPILSTIPCHIHTNNDPYIIYLYMGRPIIDEYEECKREFLWKEEQSKLKGKSAEGVESA